MHHPDYADTLADPQLVSRPRPPAVDEGSEGRDHAANQHLSRALIRDRFGSRDALQAKTDAAEKRASEKGGARPTDAGSPLEEDVRERMERSFGADFSSVRVHRDASVGRAGAHAVTSGEHVHMAPSAAAPSTRAGQELLGHELAHVIQQRSGRVAAAPQGDEGAFSGDDVLEREADRAGEAAARGAPAPLVGAGSAPSSALGTTAQAKLAGTAVAMRASGGKGGRHRSSWEAILKKVLEYESVEGGFRGRHYLRPAETKKLVGILDDIEKRSVKYLSDPDHRKYVDKPETLDPYEQGISAQERTSRRAARKKAEEQFETQRDSAAGQKIQERTSQVMLLLPRVRLERNDVLSGRFLTQEAFADRPGVTAQNDAVGGQLNRLDIVKYGDKTTYFKEDKPYDPEAGKAGMDQGIASRDPNYGARSVAMSRLDELFGTNVMARTEFGTHTSATDKKDAPLAAPKEKMGTSQSAAKGSDAKRFYKEDKIAMSSEHKRARGDQSAVSLDDPVLQQQLNIMQIIDAIAGQLDRHTGNFLLEVDQQGHVEQVTGIDLDMAFGKKQTDIDPKAGGAHSHFKGMPVLVDKVFAEKLLRIKDEQLRAALAPLLSPAELDAAMIRWVKVQNYVKLQKNLGKLVGQWDRSTARQQMDPSTSYLGMTRVATFGATINRSIDGIAVNDPAPPIWEKVGARIEQAAAQHFQLVPEHAQRILFTMKIQFDLHPGWQAIEQAFRRQMPMTLREFGEIEKGYHAASQESAEGKISDAELNVYRNRYTAANNAIAPFRGPYLDMRADWAMAMVEKYLAELVANPAATSLGAPPRPPPPPPEWQNQH